MVKFATQVDQEVLEELRSVAKQMNVSISQLVTDALAEHLRRVRVRPVVRAAMDEVFAEHDELLGRLAK